MAFGREAVKTTPKGLRQHPDWRKNASRMLGLDGYDPDVDLFNGLAVG